MWGGSVFDLVIIFQKHWRKTIQAAEPPLPLMVLFFAGTIHGLAEQCTGGTAVCIHWSGIHCPSDISSFVCGSFLRGQTSEHHARRKPRRFWYGDRGQDFEHYLKHTRSMRTRISSAVSGLARSDSDREFLCFEVLDKKNVGNVCRIVLVYFFKLNQSRCDIIQEIYVNMHSGHPSYLYNYWLPAKKNTYASYVEL